MLTFVSGWKGSERDLALIKQRDPQRNAVFILDDANAQRFLETFPTAPLIELYRNGRLDFQIGKDYNTLVSIHFDTEHDLTMRAISHVLLTGADAQIIVTFDALEQLYRLFPALRAAGSLLAANERLDAPAGDRVLFSRGGSFRWQDHILETKTSLLTSSDVLDAGIMPDESESM